MPTQPPQGGTPNKRNSKLNVPTFSVIQNRIVLPNLFGALAANSFNKLCRTRPNPLLPFLDVPVMNRVVMNVIQRGPKMTLRSDLTVKTAIPDLTPSLFVFTIPLKRRSSMKAPEFATQGLNTLTPHQHVIVIRQNAPRINLRGVLLADSENSFLTITQAFRSFASDWCVFRSRRR